MEKINYKLENLHKMVAALEASIDMLERVEQQHVEYLQDSVVARFKILIESTWKAMAHLFEHQGLLEVPANPRGVMTLAHRIRYISQDERDEFIGYISLRNLASHLYDQPQYILVVTVAPGALKLVKQLVERMQREL